MGDPHGTGVIPRSVDSGFVTLTPTVGVLALQGDVREHLAMLEACGARAVPVRRPASWPPSTGW